MTMNDMSPAPAQVVSEYPKHLPFMRPVAADKGASLQGADENPGKTCEDA